MRHLQYVNADVDHRAASLKLLSAEDAPVVHPPPPQCMAPNVKDVPELSVIAEPLDHLRIRVVSELKTGGQFLSRLLRGRDHLLALAGVHRHRLFDDDMGAGGE